MSSQGWSHQCDSVFYDTGCNHYDRQCSGLILSAEDSYRLMVCDRRRKKFPIFFFSYHKGSAPLNGGRLSGRSAEGGQPPAGVRGVPANSFSSRLLAACGGEREKEVSGDTPDPGR